MSGQPATSTPSPRVLLVDEDRLCDVFEVVAIDDAVITARSPFLFELGEELRIRSERDGDIREVTARVRAHVGSPVSTELELIDQSDRVVAR